MPYSPWLYPGQPFRALTVAVRKKGGRSKNTGRIIVRHIGGGHKQRRRLVDFNRLEPGPQDVVRIEYDPTRSAHIALLRSRTGDGPTGGWSYIIACDGMRAGDVVQSFRQGVPKGLVPKWDDEVATKVKADQVIQREEERLKLERENAQALIEYQRAVRRGLVVAQGPAPIIPSIAAPDPLAIAADETAESVEPVEDSSAEVSVTAEAEAESEWVDEPSLTNDDVSAAFDSSQFLPAHYISSPAPAALADFHIRSSPAYNTDHLSLTPPRPKPASILPLRVTGRLPNTVANHDSGGGGSTPSFALNLLRSVIIKPGNVVAIGLVPLNQPIHNIALKADGKMMLCRAAGSSGTVIGHQKVGIDGRKITHVQLQSGEIRRISSLAPCTIGQTSK